MTLRLLVFTPTVSAALLRRFVFVLLARSVASRGWLGLVALVCVASLGACGHCGPPVQTSGSGGQTFEGGAASYEGVPSDWQMLGSEELLQLHTKHMAFQAKTYGIDPATPWEFERFAQGEEWAKLQVQCLNELGIPATLSEGGSYTFEAAPKEQATFIFESAYKCEGRFARNPYVSLPLPLSQAKLQYEYLTTDLTACLKQHFGFTPTDAPSQEVWLSHYYAKAATWSPYGELLRTLYSQSETDRLVKTCPQFRPNLYPNADQLPPLPSNH